MGNFNIPVNLAVSKDTAEACASIIEIYLNQHPETGLHVYIDGSFKKKIAFVDSLDDIFYCDESLQRIRFDGNGVTLIY